jgi:hypothetical protein
VDFDELMTRQGAYAKHEHESMQCFLRDKK